METDKSTQTTVNQRAYGLCFRSGADDKELSKERRGKKKREAVEWIAENAALLTFGRNIVVNGNAPAPAIAASELTASSMLINISFKRSKFLR